MNLNHLVPAAQEAAQKPDAERLEWMRKSIWLPYPRAEDLLKKLEWLITEPRKPRMPNLLIYGPTNNGKTTILRRFIKNHPINPTPTDDSDHVPVVYAHMPPVPDERAFYDELLLDFATPIIRSHRTIEKRQQLVALMKHTRVRILILDEVQDVLAGDAKRHLAILQVLKYLGNKLQIPIVASGIESAYNAINLESQLSNRFARFELSRWKSDQEFKDLVGNFEMVLPLRKPSGLHAPEVLRMLFDMSEGVIGELGDILRQAATYSIENGSERITEVALRKLNWVKPSARHHRSAL